MKLKSIIIGSLFLFVLPARGQTSLRTSQGMVAADSLTASRAGARMLALGGDAVDAAVATSLVLGVVQPFASGIGGGGFAVVYRTDGPAFALDFREVAPALAVQDMYLDPLGKVEPDASTYGPRAAAVPGELAGLAELHRRHGKLPWKTVVQPALELARDGFPCNRILHQKLVALAELIRRSPQLSQVFLDPRGEPLAEGSLIVRPDLARTLATLSAQGPGAFYNGSIGRKLVESIRRDGGLIDFVDLQRYQPRERPLVDEVVLGLRVLSMPPPSSGGVVLVQILRALEGLGLERSTPGRADYLHRMTEAMKHAFADRANLMGDPEYAYVPIAEMLSKATAQRIKSAYNPLKTLNNSAYGGRYSMPDDGGTAHLSVLDKNGNAVALTTTINTGFGSGYVAGSTGIILNNEMDDFVAQPGVPNAFGLVGREANSIAPGKVPLSSMTPTIVLKDGAVSLVLGGSGGPTIITGTLQVLLNTVLFKMDARTAVHAPRIHHQWQPDRLFLEDTIAQEARADLSGKGHATSIRQRFNAVQLIKVVGRFQEGSSDPSKYGRAAGVDAAGRVVSETP